MKKLLYTTSALVGAAFLMEAVVPAKAEVNMSLRYRAALESRTKDDGAGKNDKDTNIADGSKDRSTRLNSAKINIDLSASKDHPNGLTTSATVAMASGANKWDYDNAFGSIAGSFGKIDIGDFHDVGYRTLGYGTPGTSNFGAVDAGFNPAGIAINTSATGKIGARASGIAYWSPSFSGAQLGVSWHPQVTTIPKVSDIEADGNVIAVDDDPAGAEGKKATFTTKVGDVEDSLAFVASYSGSFGGTGVSMGVSFEQADTAAKSEENIPVGNIRAVKADNTLATAHASTAIKTRTQDPSAYAGYISFDIDAFTVGGSYGAWESSAANSVSTTDSNALALGASYSVDALTFGLGWAQEEAETTHHNVRLVGGTSNTPSAADIQGAATRKMTLEKEIMSFTVAYQLGDGAAIDFVLEQGSFEKVNNLNAGTKTEVDRSGFGVGIDLKF